MASLANRRVQDTYTQLLRLKEGVNPESPITQVEDGAGNTYDIGAGASEGGSPYVEINSTGTLPTAEGTDSIVIGINNSDNSNDDMLLIGKNIDGFGGGQISIGRDNDPGGDGNGGNIQLGRSIVSGSADDQVLVGINNTGGDYGGSIIFGKNNQNDASDTTIVGTGNTVVYSEYSTAVGKDISISNGDTTSAADSIAIGRNVNIAANQNSPRSTAIGLNAYIDASDSLAIGTGAGIADIGEYNFSNHSIAIGTNSLCNQAEGGVAIGWNASIGASSIDTVPGALAIGANTSVNAGESLAIGSSTTSNLGLAIGHNVQTELPLTARINPVEGTPSGVPIVIGYNSLSQEDSQAIVLGSYSLATTADFGLGLMGQDSIVIGNYASSFQTSLSIAMGFKATCSNLAEQGMAIGANAISSSFRAVQIGQGTNDTIQTLKFFDNIVADKNGLIVNTLASLPGTTNNIEGSLIINEQDGSLNYLYDEEWVSVPVGGNGEDYIDVETSLAAPSATGTDSLAIGSAVNATGERSLNIGFNNQQGNGYGPLSLGFNNVSGSSGDHTVIIGADNNGGNFSGITIGRSNTNSANTGIVIGSFAESNRDQSIAIGSAAKANGASAFEESPIAIGREAEASGRRSTSLGNFAESSGTQSVAIGASAKCNGDRSFQLGSGTNSENFTVQFEDVRLANAEGLYTSFIAPSNYTPADNDNVTSHLTAIDTALSAFVSNQFIDINPNPPTTGFANAADNGGLAIGSSATSQGTRSIAIGAESSSTGSTSLALMSGSDSSGVASIAIGTNSTANDARSVAIGASAFCSGSDSFQLGVGSNSTDDSLQFLDNTIATANGIKLPYQTTGAAPTSTPADGTIVLDSNGGTTTLWARANGAWVSLISV